jgi:hypothetical protein
MNAKHNITLAITSLLSILFMTFHLSDDVVRLWSLRRGQTGSSSS